MEEDKESDIDDELLSEYGKDFEITIGYPGEVPNSDFIKKCKSNNSESLRSYQINTIYTTKEIYSEQVSEISRSKSSQVESRTDRDKVSDSSSLNTSRINDNKYYQSHRGSDSQDHRSGSILSSGSSKNNSGSISNNPSLPNINKNTNNIINGMTTPKNLKNTSNKRFSTNIHKNQFNTTIKKKTISKEFNVNMKSKAANKNLRHF